MRMRVAMRRLMVMTMMMVIVQCMTMIVVVHQLLRHIREQLA